MGGDKLGPILMQLPPTVHFGYRNPLEGFLAGLPRDQEFAVEFRDDFGSKRMSLNCCGITALPGASQIPT